MALIIEVVTRMAGHNRYKRNNQKNKNAQDEERLKSLIENLFRLHKFERTKESAMLVYDGIIDIVKLGNIDLAKKFAMRFEQEVGAIAYE